MVKGSKKNKGEISVAEVPEEMIAEWQDSASTHVMAKIGPSIDPLSSLKKREIFSRYLDLKKNTSMSNVHGVTVIVYDLLSMYSGNDYLFNGEDLKVVLEHFGYKADYMVDAGVEARDSIDTLKI